MDAFAFGVGLGAAWAVVTAAARIWERRTLHRHIQQALAITETPVEDRDDWRG